MDELKRMPAKTRPRKVLDMAYIALMAVLLAVCSWIAVPIEIPFTMQTFALFCALGLLGGRRGTAAVLVYILMGAVGLPVFSGFGGGLGRLLGVTGGYIIGFVFTGLVYWLVTAVLGEKLWAMTLGLVLGALAYYVFGTVWYVLMYAAGTGEAGVAAAIAKCVVPFLIPDAVKLALALLVVRTLPKHVRIER
ncbi:MAG: biotin transporter BioY [Butyricicoccus sp.]|nr:biotin transporter BioY [Butyricicoccus sp.]